MMEDILYYGILPLLAISVGMVFWRFVKGPRLPDRVVALDIMITIGIGIIAVYSILSDQATFLDIAMILALIAFLGTVAFAYYMEKKK